VADELACTVESPPRRNHITQFFHRQLRLHWEGLCSNCHGLFARAFRCWLWMVCHTRIRSIHLFWAVFLLLSESSETYSSFHIVAFVVHCDTNRPFCTTRGRYPTSSLLRILSYLTLHHRSLILISICLGEVDNHCYSSEPLRLKDSLLAMGKYEKRDPSVLDVHAKDCEDCVRLKKRRESSPYHFNSGQARYCVKRESILRVSTPIRCWLVQDQCPVEEIPGVKCSIRKSKFEIQCSEREIFPLM
jgi:hypothetical protein